MFFSSDDFCLDFRENHENKANEINCTKKPTETHLNIVQNPVPQAGFRDPLPVADERPRRQNGNLLEFRGGLHRSAKYALWW